MTLPPSYGPHVPSLVQHAGAPARHYVEVRDGIEKTALVWELAIHGGTFEPLVRDTAVSLVRNLPLVRGTHPGQHLERIARLHAFVRDSVPYHNEAVEILQSATMTLDQGGDCDDHAILLAALAWSLRYPFAIEPVGDPRDPNHYTLALGYPPADQPSGDAATVWVQAETTMPAHFGEELAATVRRTQQP